MSNSYLENRFCVYLHKDKDGIVRYVGHGASDRPFVASKKHRSKKWWELFPNGDPEVQVVEDGLNKHIALELEIKLFHKYRDSIVNKNVPSKVPELDFDLFNEWFYIDETSISGLRWKKKPVRSKYEKDAQAGSLLTKDHGKKYWQIKLHYKVYKVHRIVYLLKHGSICADKIVDHIDSDGLNNKVNNLRLVNFKDNCANRKDRNTIGHSNLRPCKKDSKTVGYIVKWYSNTTGRRTSKSFNLTKFGDDESAFKAAYDFRQSLVATGEVSNTVNEIPYNFER